MGIVTGDIGLQALYLTLLLLAVAGSLFFGSRRQSLGRTAQQVLIWAMIFLGVIAVHGLWGDLRRSIVPGAARIGDGRIEIPVSQDGHFYIRAAVDGQPVLFVIDTGASGIALTRADARTVGMNPDALVYTGYSQTANGRVPTAAVRLDSIAIGPFEDRNVAATVIGGDLDISLLGMDYLSRYRVELDRDRIVLRR